MKKYQVIFFGTPEIALPSLHALVESQEIEVVAVVTQPDKPIGRHQDLTSSAVKIYALEHDIPVLQPETLKKNEELEELLRELEPDMFVIISYGHIIPKNLLDIPKFGAVNIHVSLLPKYRGASPIQQALLHGDTMSGITIIKVNEKMDAGDILFTKKLPIEEADTAETLTTKLGVLGGEYIEPIILDYMDGFLKPIAQNHSIATFCTKIEKDDGRVNWDTQSAQEIFNRIRAFTPWPGCFTNWGGKRLKIIEARIGSEDIEPGVMKILDGKSEELLGVGTKKGCIQLLKVQLEGKSIVDTKTFLNGNRGKIEKNPKLS